MFLAFAVYFGCFVAAPAVAVPLATLRAMAPATRWLMAAVASILLVAVVVLYARQNSLFPYIWNTVTPFGLYHTDEYLLGVRRILWGKPVAWTITLFGVLGVTVFAGLLRHSITAPREAPARVTRRLVGLWLGWQLVYLYVTSLVLFDRHLLILVPSGLVLLAISFPPVRAWGWLRFAAVIVPLAYYCLAGTHDVHAESRLAFVAGEKLIASGVKPIKINGGYAFDAWHLYGSLLHGTRDHVLPRWWKSRLWDVMPPPGEAFPTVLHTPSDARWFRAVRPWHPCDYVISLSPPDVPGTGWPRNFIDVDQYPYTSGWDGSTRYVYVLKRVDDPY